MMAFRDKLGWGLAMAVSLALIASLAGVVWGGPLDPTAPPGSTGKNVITSLPFTISQPGSYVLNGNLTGVSGQDGITVSANNVTIDLQGFQLNSGPSNGYAITGIPTNPTNVTVRNGTITGWPGQAIRLSDRAAVDNVSISGNGNSLGGISVGANSTVSNCRVQGYTIATGVAVGSRSTVHDCTSSNNNVGYQLTDNTVATNITAFSNAGTEIQGGVGVTLENCTADGNATGGNGIDVGNDSVIRGCTARNNGGVEILGGQRAAVEGCVADGNSTAGNGIEVGNDSIVRGCTATNNGGTEIYAGDEAHIESCVADGFNGTANGASDGIRVGSRSTVHGCNVSRNGGDGIVAVGSHNRLENNEVMETTGRGIYLPSNVAGNILIGNRSQNATGGNCVEANPAGNAFKKVTSFSTETHPWINLC
jgi:parallel beta-helix repeat protein